MKTVDESKKIKIHAYNIDWAVEEEDVVDDMEGDPDDEEEVQAEIDRVKAKLPTELDFEITCEPDDDIDQLVSDAISDDQGWLTNDFDYEIIENKKSIKENEDRKQIMKKLNENSKVTLTIGQLKQLVKESADEYHFHDMILTLTTIHDVSAKAKAIIENSYPDISGTQIDKLKENADTLKKAVMFFNELLSNS